MYIFVSEVKRNERKRSTATTHPEKVDLRKCKLYHKGILLFIFLKSTSPPSSTYTNLISFFHVCIHVQYEITHVFYGRVTPQTRLDFNSVGNNVLSVPNKFSGDNSACVQVVSPGEVQLRPYIFEVSRFFKCESPSKPLCLSHHQWHKCVPLVGLARRTRGMGPWSEGNHTDKERRPEGRHRRAFEWDFLCLRVVIVSDVLVSASASRVENWGDWCGVRYVHARDFETGKINRRW